MSSTAGCSSLDSVPCQCGHITVAADITQPCHIPAYQKLPQKKSMMLYSTQGKKAFERNSVTSNYLPAHYTLLKNVVVDGI